MNNLKAAAEQAVSAANLEPRETGYYWAKLVKPRKEPPDEDWASVDWEIVCVDENYGEGEDQFCVYVPGIGPSQLIDAFTWGPAVQDTKPEASA
ncbi:MULTISPECIES: hypothetical protein [unclassified Sulfitobacter]|uniref:hypothetical protein n=1 Tax=unclassified Sulfitobacter TaxID=196795 RepID=UPI0037475F59